MTLISCSLLSIKTFVHVELVERNTDFASVADSLDWNFDSRCLNTMNHWPISVKQEWWSYQKKKKKKIHSFIEAAKSCVTSVPMMSFFWNPSSWVVRKTTLICWSGVWINWHCSFFNKGRCSCLPRQWYHTCLLFNWFWWLVCEPLLFTNCGTILHSVSLHLCCLIWSVSSWMACLLGCYELIML